MSPCWSINDKLQVGREESMMTVNEFEDSTRNNKNNLGKNMKDVKDPDVAIDISDYRILPSPPPPPSEVNDDDNDHRYPYARKGTLVDPPQQEGYKVDRLNRIPGVVLTESSVAQPAKMRKTQSLMATSSFIEPSSATKNQRWSSESPASLFREKELGHGTWHGSKTWRDETTSPPLKARKTQSLTTPSFSAKVLSPTKNQRWLSGTPSFSGNENDDLWKKTLPASIPRRNDQGSLVEDMEPPYHRETLMRCSSSKQFYLSSETTNIRHCVSSNDTRQMYTNSENLKKGFSINARFPEEGRLSVLPPRKHRDSLTLSRHESNTKKILESDQARRRSLLKESYNQGLALVAEGSERSGTNPSKSLSTGSLSDMNAGPPKVPSRRTFTNLQAIEEGAAAGVGAGLDTSRAIPNEVDLSHRSKTSFVSDLSTDFSLESGGCVSKNISRSIGMESVFMQHRGPMSPLASRMQTTSDTHVPGASMASVFSNSSLTAEQQAKLEELRRGLQNGTSPQYSRLGANPPAMGNLSRHSSTSSSPAQRSMFDGLMPLPSGGSRRHTVTSAEKTNQSSSTSNQLDRPTPRLPSTMSTKTQSHINDGRSKQDLIPTTIGQPNGKKMPFGYKAKSTNGLFDAGTRSTASSSGPLSNRGTVEANSRWKDETPADKTLKRNTIRRGQSWLETAPVNGEQRVAMKALLLGYEIPRSGNNSLSKTKGGSTSALSGLCSQSAHSRFSGNYVAPVSSSVRGAAVTSTLSSSSKQRRRESSPTPPTRKWDKDEEMTSPLSLSRKQRVRELSPIPATRQWEEHEEDLLAEAPLKAPVIVPTTRLSGRRLLNSPDGETERGSVTSQEAVAINTLIMRSQVHKSTSVILRRPRSGAGLGKPPASLGQLKRSRLSLNSMTKQEDHQEANNNGVANSTWETNKGVSISSPLLRIESKRPGAQSNLGNFYTGMTGTSTKLNRVSGKGSMIDLMDVVPRNKSDLKRYALGSTGQLSGMRKGK